MSDRVSAEFQALAEDIDAIFETYITLHELYSGSFSSLERSLQSLPNTFKKQIEHAHKAFEKTSDTVKNKQAEISNRLYSQGLVLLVGNAEALTREMFHTLFKLNTRQVKISKKINIPLADVLIAGVSDESLAKLALSALNAEGSPEEKLNFQNMQQMQGIMSGYFDIKITNDLIKDLHEFWQIRHIIIHNSSIINQRFIDNLKKAGLSTDKYTLGMAVQVSNEDYKNCFGLLAMLFEEFDSEITRLGLRYIKD